MGLHQFEHCTVVGLPPRATRELVDGQDDIGNHVGGQERAAMTDDRVVLQCSPASEAHHSSQHVDVAPTVFDDGGFVDIGSLLEHVLYLFGLYAMPANLE